MSMMWPPHRVKIVSTPSFLRAFATRWPPETSVASLLFGRSVSSAVVELVALGTDADAVLTAFMLPPDAEYTDCAGGMRAGGSGITARSLNDHYRSCDATGA